MKLKSQIHSSGGGLVDALPLAAGTGSQVPQGPRSSFRNSACSSLELPWPRQGRFSWAAGTPRMAVSPEPAESRAGADDGHGPGPTAAAGNRGGGLLQLGVCGGRACLGA